MKRIAYVGGHLPSGTDIAWGGTVATNNAYVKAFENDPEWHLDILPREQITNASHIYHFCRDADIVHLDDTGTCHLMHEGGLEPPDVIGPITRSPLKKYGDWQCPYPADWFYNARIIRLNYNEERKHKDLVTLIIHGVDTDLLQPDLDTPKTKILWAGQSKRPAKNYQLWLDIQQFPAPAGFEYHTMSGYAVQDYWMALRSTAVVVCTSLYESFCNAAFEALSCGVPVVWQKGLHGRKMRSHPALWEGAGIRCDYTPHGFQDGISQALQFGEAQRYAMRQYVLEHCTLKHMRDSYVKVFEEVLSAKTV